jgi:hypothetical protein
MTQEFPHSHRSSSPPAAGHREAVLPSGKWDSGFFDVFALGFLDMCQAHFCPCITWAQNEQMLKLREDPESQTSIAAYAHLVPSYGCLLCCGAHCFLHQKYRLRIRSLYGIHAAPYGDNGDFLLSWCVKVAHDLSHAARVQVWPSFPFLGHWHHFR